MTRVYWPQSGPSQLGKAMWWVMYAYYKKYMEDHGANWYQLDRFSKPFLDYADLWPVAYFLSEEEASKWKSLASQ